MTDIAKDMTEVDLQWYRARAMLLEEENERLRAALEVTSSDCKEAFADNERLLAANRDVMLHWDVLKADYDKLRAALRLVFDELGCAMPLDIFNQARAALEGK